MDPCNTNVIRFSTLCEGNLGEPPLPGGASAGIIYANQYNDWLNRINEIRARHGLTMSNAGYIPSYTVATADLMNDILNETIGSKWISGQGIGTPVGKGQKISSITVTSIEDTLFNWENKCVHDASFFTCRSNFTGRCNSDDDGDDRSDDFSDSGDTSDDFGFKSGDCSSFFYSEEGNKANCDSGSCETGCEDN